jgi:hypothetical protein
VINRAKVRADISDPAVIRSNPDDKKIGHGRIFYKHRTGSDGHLTLC